MKTWTLRLALFLALGALGLGGCGGGAASDEAPASRSTGGEEAVEGGGAGGGGDADLDEGDAETQAFDMEE